MSLYDVDCELGCHLLKSLREELEAVKEFVLGRRADIENDIEDLGILQPVLNHLLEEASS